MGPIDARVVDVDHHIAAGEPAIRRRVGDVGGAAQQVGGAVVEEFAAMSLLDQMHLGRPGQGNQRVGRHVHGDQGSERAALPGHLAHAEGFQAREGLGIGQRKHQPIAGLQGPTVDGPGQQLGLQLEGRMPGRHRGDVGIESQSLDRLVGALDQEGVHRQVRDHLQALFFETAAGLRVGLVGELDDVESRLRTGHQRLRQRQRFTRAGVDQGIAQHQGPRVGAQLVHRLGGVARAPRKFGILGSRTPAGLQRADRQALGRHMGRDGQRTTDGRGRVDGRRGQPGDRGGGIRGRRLYPAVQPQGTHRQGDGNNQASRRAHDENGVTEFSPWSARGGLPPPCAGFG